MEREITEINAEINAALDLLDAATAKLGAMSSHISGVRWVTPALCDAPCGRANPSP
jgi:hypothetical protein